MSKLEGGESDSEHGAMPGSDNAEHPSSASSRASELMGTLDTTVASEPRPGPVTVYALLAPQDVLAGRFVVQELTSWGGMGRIYRGRDLMDAQPVAIKVLDSHWAMDASRFAREAVLLAEVSHPAIVRYVAHGTTASGYPFLAMEWLEGEDLSRRLMRGALSLHESLRLLRRACEGIAAAHERGIIHRDIKPSNLFLVNEDPALVKVLDFGVAREAEAARTLTQSGAVLGTVGYMAPEQVRGEREIGAAADVFSLGCVLFECLTGRAAFSGPNIAAAIAKVLRDEPPRLRAYVPELSSALDAFVQRLLNKDAQDRPRNAAQVLDALTALDLAEAPAAPRSAGITSSEQRIVSVVVGRARVNQATPALERVLELTQGFGFAPRALSSGTFLLIAMEGHAHAGHAAQAASCALSLARALPALVVAMATGTALIAQRVPSGAVVERARALLAAVEPAPGGVVLDEVSARLLERGFAVQAVDQQRVLLEHTGHSQWPPTLLGRPSPFVGRDRELGVLELTLRECRDEGVRRVVLVTAAAGQGKSRLALEFVERVRAQGGVRILSARADLMGAGSAFLLVRQLIAQAVGLSFGRDAHEQEAKLRAYVAQTSAGRQSAWLADFVCELSGLPPSGAVSPEFHAARGNPQVMSVWLSRAFVAWLRAECERCPVLCVLEDLQWGDLPSVSYLDAALSESQPFGCMVLALARPEVHSAFPRLWHGSDRQELSLGGLTPRAAVRLVQSMLGPSHGQDVRADIIERADGNAFYLEELIRHAATGGEASLPETVLALLQARLLRLPPEARRVARAASVFGETFWRDGVLVLLRGDRGEYQATETTDLDAWLQTLSDLELIVRCGGSATSGGQPYRFRHALLRDAAYAMLTEADRASAHALAGSWLEQVGEPCALRLANHFELGGAADRALRWLTVAAHAGLDGGNVEEAIRCAERGMQLKAANAARGQLNLTKADALSMRCQWHEALAAYVEAAALLPPGGVPWLAATAGALLAASFLGEQAQALQSMHALLTTELHAEASGTYGMAMFVASQGFAYTSQLDEADALLTRAEAVAADASATDPLLRLWLGIGRAFIELSRGDLGPAHARLVSAQALGEQLGTALGRALGALYHVAVLAHAGHLERVRHAAQSAAALCAQLGFQLVDDYVQYFLGAAHVFSDERDNAFARGVMEELCQRSDPRLVTSARIYLGYVLARAGEIEAADRVSQQALDDSVFSTERAAAYLARATVELALQRPIEALSSAERGLESARSGALPWTSSALYLSRVRALALLGRTAEAREASRLARSRLLWIASTLDDAELRHSFLTRICVNVETLQLADALDGVSVAEA